MTNPSPGATHYDGHGGFYCLYHSNWYRLGDDSEWRLCERPASVRSVGVKYRRGTERYKGQCEPWDSGCGLIGDGGPSARAARIRSCIVANTAIQKMMERV